MFTRTLQVFCTLPRSFHTASKKFTEYENPFWRTLRILRDDLTRIPGLTPHEKERGRALMGIFPQHTDIVIIGAGPIGSSIAYWLKEKTSDEGIRVVVVDKARSHLQCSTLFSVGGLHQQFSLPENIQMSVYGAEFIRTIKKRFGLHANVQFTPHGYLVLANEEGAETLINNSQLQQELGCLNRILTKEQIEHKFPWINVSDVELGCLGVEKEGWFNPWSLLSLLRSGAGEMGTHFVQGEVVDFTFKPREDFIVEGIEEGCYEALQDLVVKLPDGEHKTIRFAYCVIAAGANSHELSQLAKIGVGSGMLSIPLPIEKRKRYFYEFQCPEKPPGINTPLTVDPSGVYFRRSGLGGGFIGGFSPLPGEELGNLSDSECLDSHILPILRNRVEAFSDIKVTNVRSGYCEYNCFDENGIIGPHPYYHNLYIATGFSGHGIQQAPAVGRAVAELILDGDFKSIDLTRLGFDRFIVNKPMYEIGSY